MEAFFVTDSDFVSFLSWLEKRGDLFVATRDVILKDGDYELNGMELRYVRKDGYAILQGNLPDEPVAQARVLNNGRVISSPRFLCHFEKGRSRKAVTMEAKGAGGR